MLSKRYKSTEVDRRTWNLENDPFPRRLHNHIILACNETAPYRTYDGSCSNLEHPDWGKAFTPQERLMPARYDDWGKAFTPQERLIPAQYDNGEYPYISIQTGARHSHHRKG